MQLRLSDLIGKAIRATDGDLGKVSEFYFDDATWTIRYLVAETGSWLFGRTVLISVVALGKPDSGSGAFPVDLTCDQVRKSPDIDTQRPVSRQHEVELAEYYLWPHYWKSVHGDASPITQHPHKTVPFTGTPDTPARHDNWHLRSSRDITGYTMYGTDGDIGPVDDFIVDDEHWVVRYLVAGAKDRLTGEKLLIPTKWIKCVDWSDASVCLNQTCDTVRNSPGAPTRN
jgi:sporulation protein YlmC with PRC-barrel domain